MNGEHIHDGHAHSHKAPQPESREELFALLHYMQHHNEDHTEELQQLADGIEGEAGDLLRQAISLYQQGNESFAKALALLDALAQEKS